MRWHVADASAAPGGEAAFGPLTDSLIFGLRQTTDGEWQVVSMSNWYPGRPIALQPWEVCGVVRFVLIAYGIAASEGSGTSNGVDQRSVGPLGCTFLLDDEFGQPDNGLFVWRFGVLLAGDAKAHQLIPALPIAPPREITEAGSR